MPAFRRRCASEISSLPAGLAFDFPLVFDFVSSTDSGADDVTRMLSPSTSTCSLTILALVVGYVGG